MLRLILHGCNGKMGQTISHLIKSNPSAEIVAGIDSIPTVHDDYPIFKDLATCTVAADVVIDFSTATAIPSLLDHALEKKIPVVVCTTGLSETMIETIHQVATQLPILFSANMSLGVNLMVSLVGKVAKVLTDADFDIEIIEKHHNKKIDAPSGTALYLADAINQAFDYDFTYSYDYSHEQRPRSKKEIGIHAMRGGSIVGEHQVIFAGEDELFEIHHKAMSKKIFAIGAINAAKFLANQQPGLYNMSDVIR